MRRERKEKEKELSEPPLVSLGSRHETQDLGTETRDQPRTIHTQLKNQRQNTEHNRVDAFDAGRRMLNDGWQMINDGMIVDWTI